jgi:hypothetical protein
MSNRSAGFSAAQHQEPEIQQIKLHKSNNGMGLSIVAAKVIAIHNPFNLDLFVCHSFIIPKNHKRQ